MVRRTVAVVAAIVLFAEAVGIVLINVILGKVADAQQMSLAGLDPDAMSVGALVAGAVFGLYLGCCGLVLLLMALRDRSPGGFGRFVLISVAVVHGLLGAFVVGPVGWPAFAFMMVVLGLIVLSLLAYEKRDGRAAEDEPAPPAPAANGAAPAGNGAASV
ncbi:hypothetical protein [Streptomyces sp. NBC_01304]|uniref:hypothetical protein n=1 Tax=Streptomyces sp. NBC_01304 TaxID=2903818 RepID=UPI002E15BC7E|nr:hypothetical protein OG430_19585 [Streptomyces sp. NBC_01304]